jgi:hypothetical protein
VKIARFKVPLRLVRTDFSRIFDRDECDATHIRSPRFELVTLVHIRTAEASMHGSFDKFGETGNRIYRRWGVGVLALPVLVVIALVGLAMTQPVASNWISEAVQAEFAGTNLPPEIASTQLAQPTMTVRAVKLY